MEVIPELMANEKTEKEAREKENMADTLQENEKSEVQNDGGMDPGEAKTIILKRKDEPVFPVPMWNAVPQENIPSQKEAEP